VCPPKKILNWHYEIGPSTDHLAKFYAGWLTHPGDLALKKNKTSGLKLKSAPQAIASGRINYKLAVSSSN